MWSGQRIFRRQRDADGRADVFYRLKGAIGYPGVVTRTDRPEVIQMLPYLRLTSPLLEQRPQAVTEVIKNKDPVIVA